MSFKDILKQLRKEKDLTQDELGNILGFTRAAISGYEIGRNEPSHEVLTKLADYFNVSIDYLLGKTSETENKIFEENAIIKKAVGKGYTKEQLMKIIDALPNLEEIK